MKAIMISVKPKYVADILNGHKTIEIRKTMPKCNLPIDVYIYCTKDKKHKLEYCDYNGGCWSANDGGEYFNGKVVAKFTLNKTEKIEELCYQEHMLSGYYEDLGTESYTIKELLKYSCLTQSELYKYIEYDIKKDIYGYAWHILNLEIFDESKELNEFSARYPKGDVDIGENCKLHCMKILTKAPQSWQYIEVLENE